MQHQSMTDKVKNVLGVGHGTSTTGTHAAAADHHKYGIGAGGQGTHGTHGTHGTGNGYGTTGTGAPQQGGILGKVEQAVMGHGTHGTPATAGTHGTHGTGYAGDGYGRNGAGYGTGTGVVIDDSLAPHGGGPGHGVTYAASDPYASHGTHGTGATHGTHGTHGTGVPHSSGLSLAEKAKLKLTGHL